MSATVALLHYTAPPVVGGVEGVLGHHARLLADAGHAVRLVVGRGGFPDPRVARVLVRLADTRHPEIVALQAELEQGRVPGRFEATVAALDDELGTALAGCDVVFAHNVGSLGLNLALTAALRRLVGRPAAPRVVLWHHDHAGVLPACRTTLHPGQPWDLLRAAWPGVEHVTVSEARRRDLAALLAIPPAAIRVVPNGIAPADLLGLAPATRQLIRRFDLLALDPLLLLPARITRRKNVELALRVVAALRAGGCPAAGLVVTGPADPHDPAAAAYFGDLVRLRRDLGLEGAVVFLTEVLGRPPSDRLVHDLYRLADLLLLPSRDEGFGIPILEAAAYRLPIVCSDLPTLRELAREGAVYVAPDATPEDAAGAVLSRLDQPPSVLARRVRAELTWEAVYRTGIAPLVER